MYVYRISIVMSCYVGWHYLSNTASFAFHGMVSLVRLLKFDKQY